jgi:hypothetical protein
VATMGQQPMGLTARCRSGMALIIPAASTFLIFISPIVSVAALALWSIEHNNNTRKASSSF